MPQLDRFTATDWYEDGRARRYFDNETMEDISLHEYRKRKREAATIDDDPDDVDELETQAIPDTPPAPRERPVFQEEPEPRAPRGRMGLAEMMTPAVAGFAASIAMMRLRNSPAVYLVPPAQVTQPILRPLGRIIDRRLIMNLAFMDSEDGRDVAEMLGALAAGGFWFTDALDRWEAAKQERYAAYEQAQYERRASSNGNGAGFERRGDREAPAAPAATGNDWTEYIRERVYGGAPGGRANAAMDAVRANGATDVPGLDVLSPDAATQRLANLYSADAEGVKRRGLDIGRGF